MASIDEVARFLDMSSREVDRLISAGVLRRRPRGEHDIKDCASRYFLHLRVKAVRKALERKPVALSIFETILESVAINPGIFSIYNEEVTP